MSKRIGMQDLAEGAIMAALSVICMMLGSFIPVLGAVISLFTAIPLTVLVARRNLTVAVIAAVAAALVTMLLLGPYGALSYLLRYGLLGLVVGYMFKKRKGAGKTILAAIIASAVGTTVMMALGFVVGGFTADQFAAYTQSVTAEMLALYEQTGMMETMRQQGLTEADLVAMIQQMMTLLPSMWVLISGMGGVAHFILSRMIFRRLKLKIPRMPAFAAWYLPFNAVWGLIIAWTVWLGADYLAIAGLKMAAQNVLLIYAVLLVVLGLSVVAHYADFKHMSSGFKVLSVFFMLFFFNGVMLLSAIVGLVDLLLDLRKIRPKSAPKAN